MLSDLKAKLAGARKSLTIWFNGAAGTLIIAIPFVHDNLPEIQQYLNADVYKGLATAVVAANLYLRFRTKTSLADK